MNEVDRLIGQLEGSKNLPTHIAIIMDGNGRWAKQRKLPRLEGHRVGRESVRSVVRTAAKIGVPYLTLYTFSLENWQRPDDEVEGLMALLELVLEDEVGELDENGVRLHSMGRIEMLPGSTRRALASAKKKLQGNNRLTLTLALSYSGRGEIVDAFRALGRRVGSGELDADAIDESAVRSALYRPELPDPDLLVRTSGEQRVSNFMLWQIAYTEIYVTDVLWPDFRAKEFCDAVVAYQQRDRRFGL